MQEKTPSLPPSPYFHVQLTAHPCSLSPEIRQISVEGKRERDLLALRYMLEGDLANFRFPDKQADDNRLWAHSCFEFFWRGAEASAYQEYNFSPSGQWAAYTFSGYRKRQEGASSLPPPPHLMDWQAREDCLALYVEIPLPTDIVNIAAAFSAVLERADGQLLYYALRHPPPTCAPDFHHPDNFSLILP